MKAPKCRLCKKDHWPRDGCVFSVSDIEAKPQARAEVLSKKLGPRAALDEANLPKVGEIAALLAEYQAKEEHKRAVKRAQMQRYRARQKSIIDAGVMEPSD